MARVVNAELVDAIVDAIIKERRQMVSELHRLRAEYAATIAALKSELKQAKLELHNLRTLAKFPNVQRDPAQPLQ